MSSPLELGPPDGDFARYIDTLLARDAAQRQRHQAEHGSLPAANPTPHGSAGPAPVQAAAKARVASGKATKATPKVLPAAPGPQAPSAPKGRWSGWLLPVVVALFAVLGMLPGWALTILVVAVSMALVVWQQLRSGKGK